jgi:hypothetical protein
MTDSAQAPRTAAKGHQVRDRHRARGERRTIAAVKPTAVMVAQTYQPGIGAP